MRIEDGNTPNDSLGHLWSEYGDEDEIEFLDGEDGVEFEGWGGGEKEGEEMEIDLYGYRSNCEGGDTHYSEDDPQYQGQDQQEEVVQGIDEDVIGYSDEEEFAFNFSDDEAEAELEVQSQDQEAAK